MLGAMMMFSIPEDNEEVTEEKIILATEQLPSQAEIDQARVSLGLLEAELATTVTARTLSDGGGATASYNLLKKLRQEQKENEASSTPAAAPSSPFSHHHGKDEQEVLCTVVLSVSGGTDDSYEESGWGSDPEDAGAKLLTKVDQTFKKVGASPARTRRKTMSGSTKRSPKTVKRKEVVRAPRRHVDAENLEPTLAASMARTNNMSSNNMPRPQQPQQEQRQQTPAPVAVGGPQTAGPPPKEPTVTAKKTSQKAAPFVNVPAEWCDTSTHVSGNSGFSPTKALLLKRQLDSARTEYQKFDGNCGTYDGGYECDIPTCARGCVYEDACEAVDEAAEIPPFYAGCTADFCTVG